MNKKNESFAKRLAAAVLANDRPAAFRVTADAMQEIGEKLMDVLNQYTSADLPFCIAAMQITSASMTGVLPDSGKDLVKNLMASCSAVVIRKDAFEQQMREGDQ